MESQIIDHPTLGKIEFPSTMSDADIVATIKKLEGPASSTKEPTVSRAEAATRAFSQGATLGFGDEIQAGIRAVGKKITGDESSVGDLYTRLRDEERAANKSASEAYPAMYGSLDIAASAPAYIASGGRAGSIKTAALGSGVVTGSQGLGRAEGTAEEQAKAAALDAIIGGGIGAFGSTLAKKIPTAIAAAPTVMKEGVPASIKAGSESIVKNSSEWFGAKGVLDVVKSIGKAARGEEQTLPTLGAIIKPAITHSVPGVSQYAAGAVVGGKAAADAYRAGKEAVVKSLANKDLSQITGRPAWETILEAVKKSGGDAMKAAQDIFIKNQTNPEARKTIAKGVEKIVK